MTVSNVRIWLVAATVAWAGSAVAQDRTDPSAYDSYVPDPASSEVLETSDTSDQYAAETIEPVRSYESAAPAEDTVAAAESTPAAPAMRLGSSYCREYQETVVANGASRPAYGTVCMQRDGTWRIVTSPTLAEPEPSRAPAESYAEPVRTTRVYAAPVASTYFYAPAYSTTAPRYRSVSAAITSAPERAYRMQSYAEYPRHSMLGRLRAAVFGGRHENRRNHGHAN